MLLGTVMKGLNALYFKKPVDFIFEACAQFLMMVCMFGFMDYLII